jgi:hypothetical protein
MLSICIPKDTDKKSYPKAPSKTTMIYFKKLNKILPDKPDSSLEVVIDSMMQMSGKNDGDNELFTHMLRRGTLT